MIDFWDRVGLIEDVTQLVRELQSGKVDTLWDYDEFILDLERLHEELLTLETIE